MNSKASLNSVKPTPNITNWELLDAYTPELPHLKAEVRGIYREKNGAYALGIRCGDIGFTVPVSTDCFNKNHFLKGYLIRMEYERGANPLHGIFTRIFREPSTMAVKTKAVFHE